MADKSVTGRSTLPYLAPAGGWGEMRLTPRTGAVDAPHEVIAVMAPSCHGPLRYHDGISSWSPWGPYHGPLWYHDASGKPHKQRVIVITIL